MVIISLLRGVNLGPHNRIKMDALRGLYESLKLRDAQTYVQSGNVVFRSADQDLTKLARRIENGIEKSFGFRCPVILRTASELRDTVARNPFAARGDIDPSRFLVTFLAEEPARDVCEKLLGIKIEPEELRIQGRDLYVYFPNGIGRTKVNWAAIEKMLNTRGTSRNWNSVTKLLAMAEALEG
jgi:uncharacterized protein (DUF1697 family)